MKERFSLKELANAFMLGVHLAREMKKRFLPRFEYRVETQPKPERNSPMLELKITNEQQVRVTLKPVTATGKPATVDGAPVWSVVSGNATVHPEQDGLSAILVSADDPGTTEFMVTADADVGEGQEEISDIIRLEVAGARASNLGLVADAPQPKP